MSIGRFSTLQQPLTTVRPSKGSIPAPTCFMSVSCCIIKTAKKMQVTTMTSTFLIIRPYVRYSSSLRSPSTRCSRDWRSGFRQSWENWCQFSLPWLCTRLWWLFRWVNILSKRSSEDVHQWLGHLTTECKILIFGGLPAPNGSFINSRLSRCFYS